VQEHWEVALHSKLSRFGFVPLSFLADKTGTLTQGKMTCVTMYSDFTEYKITGKASFCPSSFSSSCVSPRLFGFWGASDVLAVRGTVPRPSSLSCRALSFPPSFVQGFTPQGSILRGPDFKIDVLKENKDQAAWTTLATAMLCSNTVLKQEEDGQWNCLGNSSEAPLVVAAAKLGMWRDEMLKKYPRVDEIPFNSSRKVGIVGFWGVCMP